MIGIIGAMGVEVEALKKKIRLARRTRIGGTEFVSGILCGKRVVVAQSGIGKVAAALCAQIMILRYDVTLIINTGVAGTLTDELGILDFAISTEVVEHDMDTSALGDAKGLISGINLVKIPASRRIAELTEKLAQSKGINCRMGVIASGDQFINNKEKKDFIRSEFDAIACEMEGAAIGHACYLSGVDFLIIRCISDNASGEAEMEYPLVVEKGAALSEALVGSVLEEL